MSMRDLGMLLITAPVVIGSFTMLAVVVREAWGEARHEPWFVAVNLGAASMVVGFVLVAFAS
jgi:hypothetical protein